VSARYEKSSIVLTSNKHVRDWPEIFAGDEILTTAILDRLLHHVHIVHIDGRSYRLRELDGLLQQQPSTTAGANKKGGPPPVTSHEDSPSLLTTIPHPRDIRELLQRTSRVCYLVLPGPARIPGAVGPFEGLTGRVATLVMLISCKVPGARRDRKRRRRVRQNGVLG
jgi:hypothetical protein